ncbi:crossover junction endodeoxyribonuclease RuvC [bacterium]|nr:crossover junction endodeoxyribonuclease RuvC [bacterium]
MIILGIDPGTATTGYGLIKIKKKKTRKRRFECIDYGLIQTSPSLSLPERLKKINNELNKIIKKYQPELLAMEKLYFFRNTKTAIPVSQAEGVILLTAAKKKIPVDFFTPLQVKSMITNNGWAKKNEVQKKIKKILKIKENLKPDDVADALAIAVCSALRYYKVSRTSLKKKNKKKY